VWLSRGRFSVNNENTGCKSHKIPISLGSDLFAMTNLYYTGERIVPEKAVVRTFWGHIYRLLPSVNNGSEMPRPLTPAAVELSH
jgi:hypothetical protein